MNENIQEKEISSSSVEVQEFLEKCKTGNIDEKNIPADLLLAFEMFYAKRKEQEQAIKMEQFEKSLHEKYGEMYEQVETAARNAFENMAFRDAKNIIMSRMKGDIETLITFYDNVYKGLQSEETPKETINENAIFPPKAIKGGNYANTAKKQAGYENFI